MSTLPARTALFICLIRVTGPQVSAAPLGVPPGKEHFYSGAGGVFRCLDGSGPALDATVVNDDACDCLDGSDEPGTGACAGQDITLFHCANKGSTARQLYASRVGDSICDCCDGSDELMLSKRHPGSACPNVCAEQGRREQEELQSRIEMLRRALARKAEIRTQALQEREQWKVELSSLQGELPSVQQVFDTAKVAADAEREAEAARKKAEEEAAKAAEEAARARGEIAPAECMWRQTGGCSPSGNREADKDKPCTHTIGKDVSGFCDCDGNGAQDEGEPGFDCSAKEERRCGILCAKPSGDGAAAASSDAPEAAEASEAAAEGGEAREEAKEERVVSEYTKWMDGAEEATGGSAGSADKSAAEDAATAQEETVAAPATPATRTAVEEEREARDKLDKHKASIKELQDKLVYMSEEQLGYASLLGRTISKKVAEFNYEIKFFSEAKQDHTSLGRWSKWTGTRSAEFTGGSMCWGGPARMLKVQFQCGTEEEILDFMEPSRCVYETTVVVPGACDDNEIQSLTSGTRVVGPKEEL